MPDDQRIIQLQQLANIVIDAYLNRDKRFKPDFDGGKSASFPNRPSSDKDHPDLQVGYWYESGDFKSEQRS